MRKSIVTLALFVFGIGLATTTASADSITYTVESTYGQGTFAPGTNFTLSFSVPSLLTGSFSPDSVATATTVNWTSGGSTTSGPGEVMFFDTSLGGLFDLQLSEPLGTPSPFVIPGSRQIICEKPCQLETEAFFAFFGPQIFTENASGTEVTFLTQASPFPITSGPADGSGSFFFIPDSQSYAAIPGGAVSTPEPSSLALLGVSFLLFGGFARRYRLRF
jgi:PEP-CTERM motif